MSFIAGTGKTNIDILYARLKRLPQLGEELYSDGFKLCLGGGVPGTMVNLGRLNIPVRTATWLGLDMFSDLRPMSTATTPWKSQTFMKAVYFRLT